MPPRIQNDVRAQVVALREASISWRKISRQLGLPIRTVRSIVERTAHNGTYKKRKPPSRPRKICERSERRLLRLVRTNRFATRKELTQAFNDGWQHPVCERTVRRALRRHGYQRRSAARKLFLTQRLRQNRLQWCRRFVHHTVADWRHVVFSDEVRVGLRSDGRVYVWRRAGERNVKECVRFRSCSKNSIMLWGWITGDGVGSLIACPKPFRSIDYLRVLEEAGIGLLDSFDLVFMDDNAPVHRAAAVRRWLEERDITTLDWPARSPDLNPIENVWGIIKSRINGYERRPASLEELDMAVRREWLALQPEILENLYASMPLRLAQCIRAQGFPTRF